jgi:hypothetical protein
MPDENSLEEEKELFVEAPYCISTKAPASATILIVVRSFQLVDRPRRKYCHMRFPFRLGKPDRACSRALCPLVRCGYSSIWMRSIKFIRSV